MVDLSVMGIEAAEAIKRLEPELDMVLGSMPITQCARKAACCSLLPPMTYFEAGHLLNQCLSFEKNLRQRILLRMIEYYFLNAARVMGCPFLEDATCLAYSARPFGCRAYGLWSPKAYRKQISKGVEAQSRIREAWNNLNVRLPDEVLTFKITYCRRVIISDNSEISDQSLMEIARKVEDLNEQLMPWSREFAAVYSNDLGFYTTALILGIRSALDNKVTVVKEFISRGRSPSLAYLMDKSRRLVEVMDATTPQLQQ